MNIFRIGLLLIAVSAAGCASGPPELPAAATLAANQPDDGLEPITVDAEPNVVVLDEQALDTESDIRCKQMLRPASNVIERICMSNRDWKIYDRALELYAQRTLRMMQGSGYR
jgi:hypothetical protein